MKKMTLFAAVVLAALTDARAEDLKPIVDLNAKKIVAEKQEGAVLNTVQDSLKQTFWSHGYLHKRGFKAPVVKQESPNGEPAIYFPLKGTLSRPDFSTKELGGRSFTIIVRSIPETKGFGLCGNDKEGIGGVPRLYITADSFVYNQNNFRIMREPRLNEENLLVYVYDAAEKSMTFYADGKLVGTKKNIAPVTEFGGSSLTIPLTPTMGNERIYQSGYLLNLQIYQEAMSLEQINQAVKKIAPQSPEITFAEDLKPIVDLNAKKIVAEKQEGAVLNTVQDSLKQTFWSHGYLHKRGFKAPVVKQESPNGEPAIYFPLKGTLSRPDFSTKELGGRSFTIIVRSIPETKEFGFCGNGKEGTGGVPRLYITADSFVYNQNNFRIMREPRLNEENLLVYVYDAAEKSMTFYADGKLVGTKKNIAPVTKFGGSSLTIPFTSGSGKNRIYQSGYLLNLQIYQEAMSLEQINQAVKKIAPQSPEITLSEKSGVFKSTFKDLDTPSQVAVFDTTQPLYGKVVEDSLKKKLML